MKITIEKLTIEGETKEVAALVPEIKERLIPDTAKTVFFKKGRGNVLTQAELDECLASFYSYSPKSNSTSSTSV